jgi:RHS repeat-associated protein
VDYATLDGTYGYNAFGDPNLVIDPLNHQTSATYDSNRNVKTITDPDNRQAVYTYDSDNRLVQVQLPNQGLVKTGLDSMSNVISQTDPLNHTTTYSYDKLNRLTSMTDPLARVTVFGFAGDGFATARRDYLGRTTANYPDQAKETLGTVYSDGFTTKVTYTYDADGQRLTMKDATGTSSYSYDSLHRLTSYTDGAGNSTQYGYDLNSHLLSITYPGGANVVTRTYDSVGRLSTVKDWLAHTTTYLYDADSNLSTATYPNTTKSAYTYDNADHLTQILDTTGTKQTQFLKLTYTRDPAELITAEGATTYGYDPLERLSTAGTTTYGYDGANNLTSVAITGSTTTTLAYDAASQVGTLTKMNGASLVQKLTYTYDNAGNRTKVTDQNNVSTTLSYDQASRLSAYGASGTYKYNGDSLRTSKTVSGTTTQQVWAMSEGLPTIVKDGTTAYVTGLRGLPLEQIVTSGRTTSVYYYHQDQLGSTRVITDSKGATVNTYNYDPFGNVASSTGTLVNPFRYAGQYFDLESGLYYLRTRYYDPVSSQFITRDPIVFDTRQPYSYVGDDPINAVDLSGLGSSPDPGNPLTWNWGAGAQALIDSARAQDWGSAFTAQNFADSAHTVGAFCGAALLIAPESAEWTGPCIAETGLIALLADGWLFIHGEHSPERVLSIGLDVVDIFTGGLARSVSVAAEGRTFDDLLQAYSDAVRWHKAYVGLRYLANQSYQAEVFGTIAFFADFGALLAERHRLRSS